MADAWSTVVTREPEWDDYTRSRVLALAAWEARRCSSCGNYESMVPLKSDLRHVTWPDGQVFAVEQYRCLACGSADLIKRDWQTAHEKDKPTTGQHAAGDGRMFVARPVDDTKEGA